VARVVGVCPESNAESPLDGECGQGGEVVSDPTGERAFCHLPLTTLQWVVYF